MDLLMNLLGITEAYFIFEAKREDGTLIHGQSPMRTADVLFAVSTYIRDGHGIGEIKITKLGVGSPDPVGKEPQQPEPKQD